MLHGGEEDTESQCLSRLHRAWEDEMTQCPQFPEPEVGRAAGVTERLWQHCSQGCAWGQWHWGKQMFSLCPDVVPTVTGMP